MSDVTLVCGSFDISWQKISFSDLHDSNGVSPSIDGFLLYLNKLQKKVKLKQQQKVLFKYNKLCACKEEKINT